VPDQPQPRRRFRLVRWSLLGLALVGLGFLLNDRLPPRPRCTISSQYCNICLSPDGTILDTSLYQLNPFAGGETFPQPERRLPSQGPIQAWDTRNGRFLGSFLQGKKIRHGFFSPSLRYVVALENWEDWDNFDPIAEDPKKRVLKRIGEPGIFHLVDFHGQTEKQISFKGFSENEDCNVFQMASFSPKETFFIFNGRPGLLIETATGNLVKSLPGITRFHGFVPDESLMVLERKNGPTAELEIWNPHTQQVVRTLPNVLGAALSPNGVTLVANLPEGLVIVDLPTFRKRRLGPARQISKEGNAFSPDGKTMVTFAEGNVEIWDTAAGKLRGTTSKNHEKGKEPFWCSFSPDSKSCALAGADLFSVWDISSASLLWSKKKEVIENVEIKFLPDSRSLIVCRWLTLGNTNFISAKYEVLETRTGKLKRELSVGDRWSSQFDFSPDVQWLTIQDKTTHQPKLLEKMLGDLWPFNKQPQDRVRIEDVSTGRILACLESASPLTGRLSDDGKTLVTEHYEKDGIVVRVWDLPLRKPLHLIIGIPLGLGLLVFLFSRWRAWRRVGDLTANVAPK
jgi:WD40 repeat protein